MAGWLSTMALNRHGLHQIGNDNMHLLGRDDTTTSNPLDIAPLDPVLHDGLIAISVLASLSLLATFTLLCFITYRFIFWQKYYKRNLATNQYVVLIYNLLIADFMQSLAFILCIHWARENAIRAGNAACFLQGLLLQAGDPGSGLFVLTIAGHTFLLVHSGRMIDHRWFVVVVIAVWLFLAVLITIPLASHGAGIFIPSGAWCWINDIYEADRLYTHYLWIFLAEFGTVVLYAIMFIQLRRQMAASSILATTQLESLKRLRRVVGYMVLYPVAYVVLSLPLAAGRMMSAQGKTPSMTYFIVAGAMMTSSGLVDVFLYALTRRNLVTYSESNVNHPYENMTSNSLSHGRKRSRTMQSSNANGMTTTITSQMDNSDNNNNGYGNSKPVGSGGGWNRRGRPAGKDHGSSSHNRDTSTDNIIQRDVELAELGKVYQETTIEVTSEPAYPPPP